MSAFNIWCEYCQAVQRLRMSCGADQPKVSCCHGLSRHLLFLDFLSSSPVSVAIVPLNQRPQYVVLIHVLQPRHKGLSRRSS